MYHLLQGMFIACPLVKCLVLSLDLGKVFCLLSGPLFELIGSASYLHLSMKLVFLLAVVTSHRGSEIHALSMSDGHI